jgi:hypothetical protein
MQCILGVDISCQPCELTVSQVDGTQVEVLYRSVVSLPVFASHDLLKTPGLLSAASISQEKVVEIAANSSSDAAQLAEEFLESNQDAIQSSIA